MEPSLKLLSKTLNSGKNFTKNILILSFLPYFEKANPTR